MLSYLMIFHGIISILLILTVLLQFGRGAEAGLISGGASEAVFSGAQRGNILSKITSILAILFLGNSIVLAKLQSTNNSQSLLDKLPVQSAPAIPVAPPAPKADAPVAPKK
ncbi:MAG: preprotein translocase subunit SecG [Bacteriovoracaceae bacterium]|nr:preprotein translocase subunit SecG [Bacteriovoracaceae bacterium]